MTKSAPRRILVTSALPYINGVKHLGNLAGSMLPADVYARFQRLRGHDVLYICATDEHGTPAELAAQAADVPVRQYVDEQHAIQKKAGEDFLLSYDHFGRSCSPQNAALTQHFAHVLEANGLIEERSMRQVYSIDDGRFLPDRYVEGTCPHCEFEKARGDQCDNCGRLLDPVDLIDPYSAVSGSKNVEIRETRHLFLLQSQMQDRIRDWIEQATDWPPLARSIALKWLDEGLRDRAITRDLSWGVPVTNPNGSIREGFETKVFYVWFDAPIEYIGATQEWAEANGEPNAWRSWWRTDEGADGVDYVQFMGKDNVAFHTVGFPVTILGSQEPWKLVDRLKAFNWVTWYGGKFSTSNKRGVFMDQALDLLPADYWRWYLTANAPEGSDAAFTWEGFQSAINSDLANVLGNFVNRITKYCASKFDGRVPEGGTPGDAESWMIAELETRLPALVEHYENMDFRKAAAETRAIWAAGNEYLTKAEPWVKYKSDVDAAAIGVRAGLNLAALFGIIAQPIIPEAAAMILDALGVPEDRRTLAADALGDIPALLNALPQGHEISPPDVLFRKIEDEQVAEWTKRFGGDPDAS
ncbi:MAG: methionine--tRNA ligase [Henriciella sp.]|jgi:methionyl-tRNA synthetase|uniref:methionine--tRNA ligase n=1 Tax=Henriciella sp. TaxID=1968823 RepID=UPI000C11D25E|nr:methionine--tRNA ligase [Henriciella sp.]MAN73933.1 methionine--tRNA ligase [Henriciella sp.]MBF34103.1 methionine--tRNA ligase [Hyphomonadaceae bacterium]PHR79645.1 MAG: methionine--tRNA ligase [Henriciella sp.]|tara:strand:- start:1015 stop:2766 length:1752 start_codon:yes stop_codon:yes gene_type:complete